MTGRVYNITYMMNDIQESGIDKSVLNASPQELADLYDSYLASQSKSDGTRRIYTYLLTRFFSWLGDIPWYRVHSGDILRWRDDLMKDYKHRTITTHFAAVRSFYDYMLSSGILKTNRRLCLRSSMCCAQMRCPGNHLLERG